MPPTGGKVTIPLTSVDEREFFLLDVNRGRIDLVKGTYQNRARNVVILARLDFGSKPHRNPDGEEIPSPHLHVYREGYGDTWAYPLDHAEFPDVENATALLGQFMRYCNVTEPPIVRGGLFS